MVESSTLDELQSLLEACLARGNRPIPLPHCAICARYAHENLPFEAMLAIIESLPPELARTIAADLAGKLAGLPAAFCQQQVTLDDVAAMLDAPSLPLVRSLVVDLSVQEIGRFLSDPRLEQIEELTLLGYAYGGPDITTAFLRELVESPSLRRVRKLTLHSGDVDQAGREIFWNSTFAAQLEQIDGFPYAGEPVSRPLQARTIGGLHFFEAGVNPEWSLLSPAITPRLEELRLSGGFAGLEAMLRMLSERVRDLARLSSFAVSLHNPTPEQLTALERIDLPQARVSLHPSLSGNSVTLGGNILHVVKGGDHSLPRSQIISEYGNVAFVWDAQLDLPDRLQTLQILIPPQVPVEQIIECVSRYEHLTELTIAHPFSFDKLQAVARGLNRPLEKLQVVLSLATGYSTTPFQQDQSTAFQSDIPASQIWELAMSDAFAGVGHLTIVHNAMEISRTRTEIVHMNLGDPEAARAVAQNPKSVPIELLRVAAELSADDILELVRSRIFGRVSRLVLAGPLDDAAMATLVGDAQLAHVRILQLDGASELSDAAFEMLVNSPNLRNVLDFSYWAGSDNAVNILARSRLLPRLVALGCGMYQKSEAIPGAQSLPLLRHLDETLTMTVFGDARQARKWLAARPSTPLRASLAAFIER
ncbi:MAG TPA: hypothetical protein VHB77_06940, partial [Planctomycetaceae bacterium]|nr:hypothetical protein [Planctomycetaceae bacterium]